MATRTLRLGQETRWRPGAPAQILRKGTWHAARVTDLKMEDTSSKTHSVMNVKVRYKRGDDSSYRCKWTTINVPLAQSLEAGVTHEYDKNITAEQAQDIPFTPADASAYLLTIHDHLENGHGSPEALARAAQRVACVGIKVESPVTITKLTGAIRSHIKKQVAVTSTSGSKMCKTAEDCACTSETGKKEDCECAADAECCGKPTPRSASEHMAGKKKRDATMRARVARARADASAPLDMSALAAVIGDDPWIAANMDVLSGGSK